jgi:predicted Zn-dependent protease
MIYAINAIIIRMNRRKFLGYVGCGCCNIILTSCSTAPITERKQLKLIPEAKLNAQAAAIYEKIKSKEKMSDDIDTLNNIKKIGNNMEISIGKYFDKSNLPNPANDFEWEYILIDNDKVRNAWCMPGGKIAVYTGILKITKNQNGLAAVMGHEIAHAVAKHSVERASRGIVLNVATQITDILSGGKLSQVNRATGMNTVGLLSQIGILNPFNRKQESEADYLGLIFSSLSGYDIRETVKIWERMKAANKGKEPPEFMSTHPSSTNRIKNINGWTNQVIMDYPPILAS